MESDWIYVYMSRDIGQVSITVIERKNLDEPAQKYDFPGKESFQ